ncbi:hypothetical protein E6C27_scaffold81G001270 [Cucumis melo var. makuwa]|uniref:Uncharacterized protein n=1 Tax=Cucumis melo var. makuwa TaxID=1194695 RepID=A0A5A7SNX2_CUCMM|nr:hypothetical protein E6C27_scaffold81G001270 [Cucumis melo var. makuwa]
MKVAVSYISAQIPLIALASMINPWQAHLGLDTSDPHRKLTLFHTLPVDATAAFGYRRGMKGEEAGKKRLFPIGSPLYQALVRPIHDYWAMTGKDSLPVILTSCMIAGFFGNPFATSWT